MSEEVISSPGVTTTEIDLSGPTLATPVGVPAGVIGTSLEGPAFVPLTVASISDFMSVFGPTDGEKFGPLAVNEWLKKAQALTYVRVLGAGDGKKKDTSTGKVTNAGFLVGDKIVQDNGLVSNNPYANADGTTQIAGRTYFLGCMMKDATNSTLLTDAGIQGSSDATVAATADVTVLGAITVGKTIELTNTAGTSITYTSRATADFAANEFDGDTGAASVIAASLGNAVNDSDGHNGTIVATLDGETLTFTQNVAGAAGNTPITTDIIGAQATTAAAFSGGSSSPANRASPILRGVLFAARGVHPTLSGSYTTDSSAPASTLIASASIACNDDGTYNPDSNRMKGAMTGAVEIGSQQFTLLLNGHIGNDPSSPRVITGSFDINGGNYFGDVLNTDPYKIEEKGHYLYAQYDIHSSMAVVTGSGVIRDNLKKNWGAKVYEPIAFLLTGAQARDTSTSTAPNYESFQTRFKAAKAPYVISQKFGGSPSDLFRIVLTDDGEYATTKVKVSIENITPSTSDTNLYGTFDLIVRNFSDTDEERGVIEQYRGVNLDPTSTRFVARVVGDQAMYFDFDKGTASQKVVVEGNYPVNSNYIRVKQSAGLLAGEVPDNALPMGYRGPRHLITSGTQPITNVDLTAATAVYPPSTTVAGTPLSSDAWDIYKRAVEPPIPMRESVSIGAAPTKSTNSSLYWGSQWTLKTNPLQPNLAGLQNQSMKSFSKFFPMFHPTSRNFQVGNNAGAADSGGTVLDSDKFNNNKFSLENVSVRTGSDTYADPLEWVSASYTRNGVITANAANKTRALKVADLKQAGNRTFGKFTFFLQGGFDGSNIFDKDKFNMTNAAVRREMDDASLQGGTSGPTVGSFRKALDVMGNKTDVDIQLLAVPGMRHTAVSDYAVSTVENRFDAMYIMDIEERDTLNSVVTASADQVINVTNTVTDFRNRSLDTSFAAAYFPDTVLQDPVTLTNVRCPPSVAVLGAFSLNDAVGHPWFAPAGFTRGSLGSTLFAAVDLNRANLDDLYDADINPLTDFPGTGVVVFGQKTLQAAASALDRVNVRRLLIDIRRSVRAIANIILFEPNRQSTLDKFSGLVNPLLQSIQERSGLDRFKVIIDSSTTTQADIENNTIRGKIFLQPTRTAEFISLDFVVTNAGAEV